MIKHSTECQAAMTARTNETVAYLRAWPDHCRRCHGWGGFHSTYDPSPDSGLSPGSMADFDTCPDCYDKGLCPRCLAPRTDDHDDAHCQACSWDEWTDGCPEPAECCCWTFDEGPTS